MKYDFETVMERNGTNSLKWDLFDDDIPMWVADMDFKVAPAIQDAILKRAKHPVYGYTIVPEELFESYNLEFPFEDIYKEERPFFYRHKVMAPIQDNTRGFYELNSRKFTNIKTHLICTFLTIYRIFIYNIRRNSHFNFIFI